MPNNYKIHTRLPISTPTNISPFGCWVFSTLVIPVIAVSINQGYTEVGKNITQSCEAVLGRPAATNISWLFDGQPIDTSRFVVGATTEVPDQATETMTVKKVLSLPHPL